MLKNIELSFFSEEEALEALKNELNLTEIPAVIGSFDISHLSGTSTVGSMVQFQNVKPAKSNYRRFKIKTIDGIDDVGAIAEVVWRRYTKLVKEESELPDLIVIDGGIGKLNSAHAELRKLGLRIPIIAIAKKFEEVYVPGLTFSLRLDRRSKALKLIQQVRDDAHRFAISYNRLLRKKSVTIT